MFNQLMEAQVKNFIFADFWFLAVNLFKKYIRNNIFYHKLFIIERSVWVTAITLDKQDAHVSKKEKQDLKQTKEVIQAQKGDYKPEPFLDKDGKQIFYRLVEAVEATDVALASVDMYQLSILAETLLQYSRATQILHKEPLTIDGKRNPAVMIQGASEKTISSLLNDLSLSRNQRIKQTLANIQNEAVNDPFAELMQDDWWSFKLL